MTTPVAPPRVPGRVVLAVDPSAPSRHAVTWAARQALVTVADDVALVSVVPSPPLAPLSPGVGITSVGLKEYDAEFKASKEAYRAVLQSVYLDLLQSGHVAPDKCQRVLLDGDGAGGSSVGDPLINYAREHQATHLVVGSRGLSAFKRGMYALIGLGSVSDHIVRHAPCAVTVVPMGEH